MVSLMSSVHLWISEIKYAWSNEQKWTIKWQCSLCCWFLLATTGPDPLSDRLLVTLLSAFPTCTRLTPEGLAFKRRAHVLSYVGQFQGGILKRAIALLWEKETAETEIVHVVTGLSRSQSIQPIIPKPSWMSWVYVFSLSVRRIAASTWWQVCDS